jgi:hypothetical protein
LKAVYYQLLDGKLIFLGGGEAEFVLRIISSWQYVLLYEKHLLLGNPPVQDAWQVIPPSFSYLCCSTTRVLL